MTGLRRIAPKTMPTLFVLLALAVTSLGVLPNPAEAAADGSNPVLGVYAGAAYPPAVPAFTRTIGTKPGFAMDFLDGTTGPASRKDAGPTRSGRARATP